MSTFDEGYVEPVPYRLPAGSLARSLGGASAVPRRPRAARRLAGVRGLVDRLGGALAPHRAALARLRDMPLTVAGAVCVDFAAFHYVHAIGWLVTGVSLMLIERIIADED